MDEQEEDSRCPRSIVNVPGLEEAQKRMEQVIVETEKFKAAVEKPPGTLYPSQLFQDSSHLERNDQYGKMCLPDQLIGEAIKIETRQIVGSGLSDDDFFHLTCHIDASLRKEN